MPERSPVRALLTNKGDVIICGLPRYRGARDCIFINDKGTLPHSWWNNIESYRWVTRTECLKAGPLPIQPGATYGASAQQCGGHRKCANDHAASFLPVVGARHLRLL